MGQLFAYQNSMTVASNLHQYTVTGYETVSRLKDDGFP